MNDPYRLRMIRHIGLLAGLFLLVFTRPSQAYVDPGSASVIITAILGMLAAVGYTARLYWRRFTDFFRRSEDTDKKSKDTDKKSM